MSCAWEGGWRGAPGGKEPPWPRIRASLAQPLAAGVVMLLCPCFQPGIFVHDHPQVIPDPGGGWDASTPAQKHLGILLSVWWPLLHAGLDCLSKMGVGRIKIKPYRSWDGNLGVSTSWWCLVELGAGLQEPAALRAVGPTELLARFPQGNLMPCPWRPRRSPRAASTRT